METIGVNTYLVIVRSWCRRLSVHSSFRSSQEPVVAKRRPIGDPRRTKRSRPAERHAEGHVQERGPPSQGRPKRGQSIIRKLLKIIMNPAHR
jgi:hypothetical protein